MGEDRIGVISKETAWSIHNRKMITKCNDLSNVLEFTIETNINRNKNGRQVKEKIIETCPIIFEGPKIAIQFFNMLPYKLDCKIIPASHQYYNDKNDAFCIHSIDYLRQMMDDTKILSSLSWSK